MISDEGENRVGASKASPPLLGTGGTNKGSKLTGPGVCVCAQHTPYSVQSSRRWLSVDTGWWWAAILARSNMPPPRQNYLARLVSLKRDFQVGLPWFLATTIQQGRHC